MSLSVLGAGAFGTALAVALARDGRQVTLWARDPDAVAQITATRRAPRLPDVPLPASILPTADLMTACAAPLRLLAVPAQQLAQVLNALPKGTDPGTWVLCCKGLDLASGRALSSIAAEALPGARIAVLTGPSFAADIARGLPTALTLACADETAGQSLQQDLSTPVLRLYRSTDVTGAELGGALKNVIAIACGVCIGAGLGDSARAAILSRGFAEMTRLAVHLGARPQTLSGLSGLGDLTLTCTSTGSRNFRFGQALGAGAAFDPTITVEGAATARATAHLARRHALSLPICTATAALTEGRLTVAAAMDQLLSRPLKEE